MRKKLASIHRRASAGEPTAGRITGEADARSGEEVAREREQVESLLALTSFGRVIARLG